MAATSRGRRAKRRRSIPKLPLLAAGLGAIAARDARAQSSLEFRYLLYKESGGRTEVSNPWVFLNQNFGLKGGQLSLLLGYDTISGASPTGAYPTLDTTTSASGTTSTSSVPLAQYHDTRKSITASYGRKFGANMPSIDLSYSKENDYLARSVGLDDAWTMAGGRGTLHMGISFARDVVTPVTTRIDHDKSSNAFALGWSWIVSERDLFDISGSLTKLSGYLDDPYKVVPVGTTTVPEHRPDSRSRYAALVKYGHFFVDARGAVKLTYRYYWDDWSIGAHTLEVLYDQHAGSHWTFSPLLRLYTQSHASFFGYQFGVPLTYMSADYRLSAFRSVLGGLTIAYAIRPDIILSVGATYQDQRGIDRVVPLVPLPPPPVPPVPPEDDGGPGSVSAADMRVVTGTVGLTWRY